ncbi:MAG TPA: glycosyltransferase family 2 protein, partial [Caldimonas sp.]|nr:glycosyltransferase family 2 protein [Caldimonas sp.]
AGTLEAAVMAALNPRHRDPEIAAFPQRAAREGAAEAPLVSVITPVYNGSRYLDELILSVERQTHPRIEHIVIDDGSSDDGATVAVLARYPHLRWWSRPNRGQYATLNEGLQAARGDWVCVISADDVLASPSALADLIAQTQGSDQPDAVYGRTALMDSSGRPVQGQHGRPDESAPRWLNYHFLVIHHCSMIVARGFIEKHRLMFDTSLKFTGDWDWIIRILKAGRTRHVDAIISKYRVHEQQTRQTTKGKDLVAEDRLVLARHGSSAIVNVLIVNYFRFRKLVSILSAEGGSGGVRALKRFLRRR